MLRPALGRRQIEMDGVREDEQAEVVLERLADVGEHQHGVDGVVELGQGADAGGHHAADVEAEDHVLAVFGLEDGGDRLVAAGGGLPADLAVVVVGRVVAVVAELAAGAGQTLGPVAAGPHQRRPHQRLVAPDLQQVGVDLHRLPRRQAVIDERQAQRAAAAHRHVAELEIAALRRQQAVRQPRLAEGRHGGALEDRLGPEARRNFVAHVQRQPDARNWLSRIRTISLSTPSDRRAGRSRRTARRPKRVARQAQAASASEQQNHAAVEAEDEPRAGEEDGLSHPRQQLLRRGRASQSSRPTVSRTKVVREGNMEGHRGRRTAARVSREGTETGGW